MKLKSGLSMIETMIVIALILMFAALVGPNLMRRFGKGKEVATQSTVNNLKSALYDYSEDMGHYPTKAEGGLRALVERPKGLAGKKWKGPYLEGAIELPQDAWGFDFEYNMPPVKYKDRFKKFEIISHGEEGEGGTSKPIFAGA